MFTYCQKPPQLLHNGVQVKTTELYSGHGKGLNNPKMEAVAKTGPIPRGRWRIVRWDEHHGVLGPIVAILAPVDHDAHGRDLFRAHGGAMFNASEGCIVMDRPAREAWRATGDMDLEVI